MEQLTYQFYLTKDVPESTMRSLVDGYNHIFSRSTELEHFQNKYMNTFLSSSYHCFLMSGNRVVGNCSIIPFIYHYFGDSIRAGLVVDVFILEDFRQDPLALRNMYKVICKEMEKDNISTVIGVTNDTVYPYWKQIVRWNYIGLIDFYVLPIRLGNVIKKYSFLNLPSKYFFSSLAILSRLSSNIINQKEKHAPIRLDKNSDLKLFEQHRYTSKHRVAKLDNCTIRYVSLVEDGILATYLIDYYNDRLEKDRRTLCQAVNHLRIKESPDIVIYVGQIRFRQVLLTKVPQSKVPKRLYFMSDVIIPGAVDESKINNIANWDFGLLNYDGR